jgi:hypothetical protein
VKGPSEHGNERSGSTRKFLSSCATGGFGRLWWVISFIWGCTVGLSHIIVYRQAIFPLLAK